MLVQRGGPADISSTIEYGLIAGPQHQHSLVVHAQIAPSVLVRTVGVPLGRVRSLVVAALCFSVGGSTGCTPSGCAPTDTIRCHPPIRRRASQDPGTPRWHQGFRQQSLLGVPRRYRAGTDVRCTARVGMEMDGRRTNLELRIRDNLKFHDGTPVDNDFHQEILCSRCSRTRTRQLSERSRCRSAREQHCRDQTFARRSVPSSDLSNATISIRDPSKADVGLGPYRCSSGDRRRGWRHSMATIAAGRRSTPSRSWSSKSSARHGLR